MGSRYLAAALLAAASAFFFPGAAAQAWDRHDLITRVVLRGAPWLDVHRNLGVLPASGSECVKCDKEPYNPDYIPVFIDRLPGEKTTAREVLVRYVDEPDWGMDEAVSVSLFQALAGGSKGYRHQLYHYAPVVRVGDAPKRVEHFYGLAIEAYKDGDKYWAFRHLARALHYLQDMGQPLHTRPFLYKWLRRTRVDPERTQILAANLHFGYERLVTHMLREEMRRDRGPLLSALRNPPKMKFSEAVPGLTTPAHTAAWALAEYSSHRAPDLLADLDSFFPKRIKSTRQKVVPTPAELSPRRNPGRHDAILASTIRSFGVTAGAMLSVLEMAKRDFAAADKARLADD
ncbi:MAG: hypothetical protein FJZ01_22915 [Candidatus Sericytochromatia bacterium]|nr:hypothetical protein [Candidatus Tanganyikabacteria bacterium]